MGQACYKDDIDVHAKVDSPLSDRGPSWRWSPGRCDSTTAAVLLADGMVRPSQASEHMDAVWGQAYYKDDQ